MEIAPYYNSEGVATAYIYENEYIYLYNGKPVGYCHGEYILFI
ncbi:4-fold beta flower protein [Pedobacter sp. ISL-64]